MNKRKVYVVPEVRVVEVCQENLMKQSYVMESRQ